MSTSKGSILLTGANGGIGGGIATEIIKSSYGITHETLFAVRDPAKAESLKAILKHAPKDHKHDILPLDLSSLESVRSFAADINRRVASGDLPPLQAVILNAGLQDVSSKHFTKDGMERTFGVNYLSNFLLVLLLLG
jgi:NAD(P)-dependent dehydrogenase (short-subunit alcohol dehydrogenase family)